MRCQHYDFKSSEDGAVLPIRCKDEAKEKVDGYEFCQPHADARKEVIQTDPDRKAARH